MNIFEDKDYRNFIKKWISSQPRKGRGVQAQMADASGMQATFLSLVLNKKAHPSVEQAFALSEFMRLSELETDYFQIQVQLERAGTETFKKFLHQKKKEILKRSQQISEHLEAQEPPAEFNVQKYFSSWIYPAIHLLIIMPEFSTVKKVANRLHLQEEKIEEALQFLTESRILEKTNGGYQTSKLRLHAEKGSPQLMSYQLTTRSRATQRISENSNDLHFTSIHSASREDFEKLKEDILALIRKSDRRISKSKEEDIFGFTIDLFHF